MPVVRHFVRAMALPAGAIAAIAVATVTTPPTVAPQPAEVPLVVHGAPVTAPSGSPSPALQTTSPEPPSRAAR